MTIDEISTVCFVGSGTMGCANSLVAAVAGYQTVLFDVSEDSLAASEQRHRDIGAYLVDVGFATSPEVERGHERITRTTDLGTATAEADLVSESVPERLDLKRSVHRDLDELCAEHAILTTNTSSLLVSDIEGAVERGDRFAALHSHLGSLLVDIVGGPRTAPATIEVLERYVVSIGAMPLVLKREHRGYVVNAMIGPLLAEALRLHLVEGAAIAEVDGAWRSAQEAPLGPFAMMDLFGLDLILDHWSDGMLAADRAAFQPAVVALLQEKVDAGELGLKAGAGFFRYPSPGPTQPNAQKDLAPLADRLFDAVIASARDLEAAGVADRDDIDRAWTTATLLARAPLAHHRTREGNHEAR